ncbi:MAG: hypothetical protein AAFV43_10970 [Planctomycetota bacterium]
MDVLKSLACVTVITLTTAANAAVRMEIASESGPNANAQREWLQLLAELGVSGVRIRGVNPGDEPRVEDLGSPDPPLPRVLGVLDRRGVLYLPGGRFTIRDRTKLAAYLARLEGDGAASVTAERGAFGLTRDEFETVFRALGEPIGVIDNQQPLRSLVERAVSDARLPLEVDRRASPALSARPATAKVDGLARGTALAILLRAEGLLLHPEKPVGGTLRLRIASSYNNEAAPWPIGYEPDKSPGDTSPALMESIPVEISGFTLAEALDAIEPRLGGTPIVFDAFALRRDAIDPAAVQVELARTKTFYKRIIDRLAFQARLKTELRVDEAGEPFIWLTR